MGDSETAMSSSRIPGPLLLLLASQNVSMPRLSLLRNQSPPKGPASTPSTQ